MRPVDADVADRAIPLADAAWALHLEALAAAALGALAARGVSALLLKGPVIARWLYADGEDRAFCDVDVLVDPARLREARDVVRALPGAERVDLHDAIPGVGAHPARAFARLRGHTTTVPLAGVDVPILDEVARTLHVALHAGWHGPDAPQPLRDLELAAHRVPPGTWSAAAALARELDALDGFVTGLELIEAGRALRRRLGLPEARTTRARIGFDAASPAARRLADLAMASGPRAKARVLRGIVLPSRFDVERRYPGASVGTLPLVLAHLRRMTLRLVELPGALRTMRSGR